MAAKMAACSEDFLLEDGFDAVLAISCFCRYGAKKITTNDPCTLKCAQPHHINETRNRKD